MVRSLKRKYHVVISSLFFCWYQPIYFFFLIFQMVYLIFLSRGFFPRHNNLSSYTIGTTRSTSGMIFMHISGHLSLQKLQIKQTRFHARQVSWSLFALSWRFKDVPWKSSHIEICFISRLILGYNYLFHRWKKIGGSPTLFRRKRQGKNVLISIDRWS